MQSSLEVSYVPNIHKSIESLYFDPSYFGVDVEVGTAYNFILIDLD